MRAAAFMLFFQRHVPGRAPALLCRRLLSQVAEDERPVVTLASATHDIEGVRLARDGESLVRYTLRPYDGLRSIPRLTGGHASAFGPDGRIAGSAARQWGRQADGRDPFDDGELLERRFELEP